MEISGEYSFNAPIDRVWEVLRDPRVLATILPMAMNMKQVAGDQYTGDLFFRVGNVAGTFRGKITLSNIEAPTQYDIEVHGSSSVGHVSIKGNMYLETHDDQTTMFYKGGVSFGGRIASVGSRMLDTAVRSILQQSFKALNSYLSIKRG